MPELSSSGEIYTLDGSAGFDEGIVRGDVGSGARLTYDGHFELCHALSAALSAEIAVDAEARLAGLFILTGLAQGEALAAAGLEVGCGVQFDIFDSFGLSAEAAAYAEAAVAGSLSGGFTTEDIARALRPLMTNVAYDILIYFLNEVDISAGVWGKAAVAAMAKARLKVKGSLAEDDDAGFIVSFGAEAGLGAGAGYDGYVIMRLRNPKRFYLNSVERISRELSKEARRLLPTSSEPAIHSLELALPVAMNAAYELGQSLPLSTLVPADEAAVPLIENFAEQLRRFTLDKVSEAAFSLMQDVTRQFILEAVSNLTTRERRAIDRLLDGLIEDLQGIAPPQPLEQVSRVADILIALAPNQAEQWRTPATIAWVAAAAVSSLRMSVGGAQASASFGVIGLGTDPLGAGEIVRLPEPTGAIAAELDAFFNPMPPHLELVHAVGYLAGTGAEALYLRIPGLHEALDPLLAPLDLSGADLLRAAIDGSFSGSFATTELYQHLRAYLKDAVDDQIATQLIPALRTAAPADSDFTIWLDEAAEPSLLLLGGFVFDRLDVLVDGGVANSDVSPFMQSFRSALSAVVSQIVVRNTVVVADVLREHAYDGLSDGFHALSVTVANAPNHPVAVAAGELVRSLVPPGIPLPSDYGSIAAHLIADLFDAASDGFDPSLLSDARRAQLRALQVAVLLSIDGTVDYSDASDVDRFFREAAECLYIPAPDASVELVKLQIEILADQAIRMFPKVERALRRFFIDLTEAGINDLDKGAREFLAFLLRQIEDAWEWLESLNDRLIELGNDIRDFGLQVGHHLHEAGDALKGPSRRTSILNDVADLGAVEARRLARQAPGFGFLPPAQQLDAQNVAEAAFRGTFSVVRPALNEALKIVGTLADDLANVIQDADNLTQALTAIGQEVDARVEAEVRRQLGVFGVILPNEISPATVAAAARDFLRQLPPLRDALEQALAAKDALAEAIEQELRTTADRDAAHMSHQAAVTRRQQELGGALAVEILSPLPVVPNATWAHRHEVSLRLRITGARLSFIEGGNKRRVRLTVNGSVIKPQSQDWDETPEGIVLTTRLASAQMRRGLNSIECSVTNGRGSIVREQRLFVFQPQAALTSPVDFDDAASQFGGRFDTDERVVLVNRGRRDVSLAGWSLYNEARDRFVFPNLRLQPGEAVAIESGKRPVLSPPGLTQPGLTQPGLTQPGLSPPMPSRPPAGRTSIVGQPAAAPSPTIPVGPLTPPSSGFVTQPGRPPPRRTLTWQLAPVWRHRGDTVVLVDAQGVLRLAHSFGDRA